jgi:hypothetical protein
MTDPLDNLSGGELRSVRKARDARADASTGPPLSRACRQGVLSADPVIPLRTTGASGRHTVRNEPLQITIRSAITCGSQLETPR